MDGTEGVSYLDTGMVQDTGKHLRSYPISGYWLLLVAHGRLHNDSSIIIDYHDELEDLVLSFLSIIIEKYPSTDGLSTLVCDLKIHRPSLKFGS